MLAIDCAEDYGEHAAKLKSLGVDAVIRYFNPLTKGHDSGKSLRPEEAKLYAAAGLKVGIVVEGYGMDNGRGIDHQDGLRDAMEVLDWLPSVGITPSPDLVVWFAVDTDVNANQINNNVVSYFDAIQSVFQHKARVGIYGSGWACFCMVGTKRADVAWVAGSHGWEHYQSYVASNAWTLLQHIGPHEIWNGFNADTNDVNEQHGTAGFVVPFDTSAPSGHTGGSIGGSSMSVDLKQVENVVQMLQPFAGFIPGAAPWMAIGLAVLKVTEAVEAAPDLQSKLSVLEAHFHDIATLFGQAKAAVSGNPPTPPATS